MRFDEIKSPCFILDYETLFKNVTTFKAALCKKFPRNILGYSLKTNSLPQMLVILNKLGCYAEVVSYTEYELALLKGFDKTHIIYNGPLKSKETFLDAIKNGAIVNIETKRELDWLAYLDPNKKYGVGIRVNLDLGSISPDDAKRGEAGSRFGFSFENGELESAINSICSYKNIIINGLHLHRTSLTRSLKVYRNICHYAGSIISKLNLRLDYIDIGGGYFGDKPNTPTYAEYINVIYESLKPYIDVANVQLIVEPGNAIVASPFSFVSEVIDTKTIGNIRFVVTDGSRNDIDPFFQKKDYFKKIIRFSDRQKKCSLQTIVGCSCLEYDKLFSIVNEPEIEIGDKIIYYNVGAYTMTLSPLFIRFFPKVYLLTSLGYEEIRQEWKANNLLQ